MKKILMVVLIFCFISQASFAQEQMRRSGPRRQLATIVFAGLGGAILGLSTLPFYPRPQDQLVNIAMGFAVGVFIGVAYVTVKSATTRDYYDPRSQYELIPDVPLEDVEIKQRKLALTPFVTSTVPQKPDGLGAQLTYSF